MSKKKDNIDDLLVKVLTGTASVAESEEVELWAKENEKNSNTLDKLKEIWQEKSPAYTQANSEDKIDNIWDKGIKKNNASKSVSKPFLKYAASILLFFGFLSSIYYFIPVNNDTKEEKLTKYTVRSNPPGQKSKLTLPDGSIVYLNCSSSIKYIVGFEGEERKVELIGEAYFEVASNAEKPFIVESNRLATKALGTIFNINAYPDCELTRISLLEGKVEIQNPSTDINSILLTAGKELQVNTKTNTYTESTFDPHLVVAWKEGALAFKNSDFNTVKLNLERWFGVDIHVKGKKPEDWSVTTVYKGQTLKNILMDLQYSKKFAYEINDDQIIIEF